VGGGLLVARWVQSSGACGAVEVVGGAIGCEWSGEGCEGVGGWGGKLGVDCRLVQRR